MNLDIASDNPFGDADAFNDFLGQHEIAHQQINEFMQRKGLDPQSFPLCGNPETDPNWLSDHYQLHINEFLLLNLGEDNLPDISVVNFKDQEQYSDWMYTHSQIHDYVNQVLGITS
jgi:hypothetical protein